MMKLTDNGIINKCKKRIFVEGRKPWVDFLRAIAIALVIFGHHLPTTIDNRYLYFLFTSPIKLPLFFAISGYLFSVEKYNSGQFLIKILKQLVIPWIVLGLIGALLQTIFVGSSFIGSAKALFTGKSFWYMPCLIIAEVVFYLIVKYLKKIWIIIIACALCFVCGYILFERDLLDTLMFNRALCVQIFLALGLIVRHYEERILGLRWGLIAALIVIYIALGILSLNLYPGCDMDVHMCDYYCIPINFAMVGAGIIAIFALFSKIKNVPKWLSFIGQNTLLTYMLNAYPVSVFVKVVAVVGITIPNGVVSALTYLIIALIGCTLISIVVNCVAPEIVGRKRQKWD